MIKSRLVNLLLMKESEKDIRKNSFQKNWKSVIKQFQNGREEMVFQKYHCCCHYVMNWR